jgi:hypothetical protein
MVLAFLCEIAHPLVFMGMGIGAVGLAVAYAFRPHRVVLAALCFVPSLGALKYQIAHSAATPFAMTVATTNAKGFDGTWIGWREMLRYLPAYSLDSVAGDWDVTAFWLIMGAGGALILTGLPLRRPSLLRLPAGIHEYRSLLVAAAFLAAYLALPLHLARPFDWWFVSGRLAGPLLFFTVLSASGRVDGQRRNLLIPVVAALVLLFVDVGGKYADYGRRMQPMVRMTRRIPRNDSVLLLSMFPRTDPSVNVEAYRCIGAWMQVMHGGFTPSGFFNSEFPFHVINQLPSPSWSAHESFDIENQAPAWGWLMVHGAVPPALSGSKSWELMSKDGVFSLYRRRH